MDCIMCCKPLGNESHYHASCGRKHDRREAAGLCVCCGRTLDEGRVRSTDAAHVGCTKYSGYG